MSKAKLIKCLQPDRRVDVEVDTMPVVAGGAEAVAAPVAAPAPVAKKVKAPAKKK